jgi:hypothetical protein
VVVEADQVRKREWVSAASPQGNASHEPRDAENDPLKATHLVVREDNRAEREGATSGGVVESFHRFIQVLGENVGVGPSFQPREPSSVSGRTRAPGLP